MFIEAEVVKAIGSNDRNVIEFPVIAQVNLKGSVLIFTSDNFQALRCYFYAIE